MNGRYFILLFAIAIIGLPFSESKAQQGSSNQEPIRIEKNSTIGDVPGKVFNLLQTNTYETVDLPHQTVKPQEFPSISKTHKSTEADYPLKRILLKDDYIIYEVNNNTVKIDTAHFETFSSDIEAAINRTPAWLHDDLRFKFRLMTNSSDRTKMVNLLNATEKKYLDEVAFTLAHLPKEVLTASRFANTWNYLISNAEMIYAFADSLKYVRLVETGDTNSGNWETTTEYRIKQGSNYIWRKIDKYYYYMFIVMPKIEQEGLYVTDNAGSTGQRTWGYGWREYLWFNPDPSHDYTIVNCTTSIATIDTIPRLGAIMQMPDYLWDESMTYFTFNRPFASGQHAMNVLGNWCSRCIPMDVTDPNDYRPSQPNQIAWKHVGNCHEDALLVAAAARTCLIPLMHIADLCDDHVWGMFHDAGGDTWHHFEFFRGGATPLGDGRQQWWGMTNLMEYGSYGWESSLVQGYVPDGTMINVSNGYSDSKPHATLKIKITDKDGNPVDGVRVDLYSTNTQYGTTYNLHAGYLYTDSYGEINEPIGTKKKYYAKIYHPSFGSFPAESGKIYILIDKNTVSGQTYSYNYAFGTNQARTTITDNQEKFETNKSLKIDFLAKNITTGTNLSDGQNSTFYDKTETGALMTAYIVDESQIANFKSGSSSAVAQYSFPFFPSGEYNIPVFPTGKTYIVLKNSSNFTNAVELFYGKNMNFGNTVDFENPTVTISDIDLSKSIQIYPNPSSDQITISFDGQFANSWEITLFDITGKAIQTIKNEHIVSVSELPAGLYFVKINADGKTVTKKIVKQ